MCAFETKGGAKQKSQIGNRFVNRQRKEWKETTLQKLAPLCVSSSPSVLRVSGYAALWRSLSSRLARLHLPFLFLVTVLVFVLLITGHGERLHLSHLPEGL